MVYKIYGNFELVDFDAILKKAEKYFKFIYFNGVLYIALNTINYLDQVNELIKKIFKPAKNFCIIEINEKNIMDEDDIILEWCRNNFVSLESEKFEQENQNKLKQIWKAMDNMEKDLITLQNNKKGGN